MGKTQLVKSPRYLTAKIETSKEIGTFPSSIRQDTSESTFLQFDVF